MKIVATGIITQLATKESTKSNGKTFLYGKAQITSAQGKGMIVDITRTLGEDKSEVKVGQSVTLHGDTDRVLTNKAGQTFMPFEVQSGVQAAPVASILAAFGVKAAATTLEPQA